MRTVNVGDVQTIAVRETVVARAAALPVDFLAEVVDQLSPAAHRRLRILDHAIELVTVAILTRLVLLRQLLAAPLRRALPGSFVALLPMLFDDFPILECCEDDTNFRLRDIRGNALNFG